MAAKRKPTARAQRRWSLFWVSTDDGTEDCFVVASSPRAARTFFEGIEGYDPGDADAEHVADLPAQLQSATGWRDSSSGKIVRGAYYAPDALVIACGGEIAHKRSDRQREFLGEVLRDYRFGNRHFRSGDVVTAAKRATGIPESARLAAFAGEKPSFPPWWEWELELTPHLEKRMEDRDFTEVDLRSMLEGATGYREDVVEDRFVIETRSKGRPWEVVVEPDEGDHLLVVVTAYRVDR